ncbi:MAG: hypothetical protein GY906_30355 [bacterium]|nr:hypothetical protein [bacterium]
MPKVQETRSLFESRPYAFPDFVGRAYAFLKSNDVRKMGFEFHADQALPCKWKCPDESLFAADLAIYAQTGHYPFNKGKLGGGFNEKALGAAVHHGTINIDFGGSHVGYMPGKKGGSFGQVWRPQVSAPSPNCGYLSVLTSEFQKVFNDATNNILIYQPPGEKVFVNVPNEYVQPNWSSLAIKLLIDTDTLTYGEVEYEPMALQTHFPIGRSLFVLSDAFLDGLTAEERVRLMTPEPTPIGCSLSPKYFNIFDVDAEVDSHGLPQQRLLPYMKYILAARHAPPLLKAAIINTNIEHNRLTDMTRTEAFRPYAFASFSGVFIDLFDEASGRYGVLFQPLAIAIKPAGRQREIELLPGEIHERFDKLTPAVPAVPMEDVLRSASFESWTDAYTFEVK